MRFRSSRTALDRRFPVLLLTIMFEIASDEVPRKAVVKFSPSDSGKSLVILASSFLACVPRGTEKTTTNSPVATQYSR